MVRTQIQLTERQHAELRSLVASTGKSVSQLIREAVDEITSKRGRRSRQQAVERAIRIAGRFSSGMRDVSSRQDRQLAEAWK